MKSDSQIMNELSKKTQYLRELSPMESQLLKKELLDIYKDVSNLCDKYGLTYMMSGGTCLGTIRHKGFIPWDDDLDIMMPRNDYDRLIELCLKGELGDKYEISYPQRKKESASVFLKVYRKDSTNVELSNINTPFPKGIFIDVFALDAVPKSKIIQRIKGFIANALQFIAISRLYAQYPSEPLKEYMSMDNQLRKRYKLKKYLGHLMGFASHGKWVFWFDRFVASTKSSRKWGIPTGRMYYNGEIFDKEVFVPVKKAIFEGVEVNVPNDTDKYLKNLYHDYMKLPPENKRERHFIYDFKLPAHENISSE